MQKTKAEQAVTEASRLNARLVYEVIRRDGEEELKRPTRSLIWSGVAAGLLISFSVLGEAVFRAHLPDVEWRFLVENLGYSFGFLLVILGRMQLFTENTITTVLPMLDKQPNNCLRRMVRLWGIVLTANVVGAFFAALFMVVSGTLPAEVFDAVVSLSAHATGFGPLQGFLKAIPAGILIAAIVWMMPGQQGSEVLVIVLFTWLIAAGDFTHIIAGAVEMWVMVLLGDLGAAGALFGFFLPVLAGNVVGGTTVFAALAWGQVRAEVEEEQGTQAPHPR
ncbi:MAG: formate/nitrite transporter family protein [Pseudomonadota bacterium]